MFSATVSPERRASGRGAGRGTPPRAALVVAYASLTLAVGATVLAGGGFGPGARATFVVLAGVALLAAVALDARAAARLARAPLACALGALAALGLASALWAIGAPAEALRSGLTVAACAAVLVAAGTTAAVAGPRPIAAGIALLAGVEAVLGIHAVATHALPHAERIEGAWRPGGTFEYPPALALLQVAALPALCDALRRSSRLLAGAGALGALLAGAVLGLAGGRLGPALAGGVLLAGVLLAPRGSRARRAVLAATALVALSALLAPRVLPDRTARAARAAHAAPAAFASGGGSDLLHGRAGEWRAALRAWEERPLLGAGAGSYVRAAAPYRGAGGSRFAHDLPLELAAELGAAGLLCALALYAAGAWTILRSRGDPAAWLLGPAVGAFLVANLVDWSWHLAGLAAVWAAAAGGLQAAGDRAGAARRRPRGRPPEARPTAPLGSVSELSGT